MICGLRSAVSEYLSEVCPIHVLKVGVCDVFDRLGNATELMSIYGLTAQVIADNVKAGIATQLRQ